MPDGSNFGFFEEESELPWPAALLKTPPFWGGGGGGADKAVPKWSFQQISIIWKLKMCF